MILRIDTKRDKKDQCMHGLLPEKTVATDGGACMVELLDAWHDVFNGGGNNTDKEGHAKKYCTKKLKNKKNVSKITTN